jgi:regulatory protein
MMTVRKVAVLPRKNEWCIIEFADSDVTIECPTDLVLMYKVQQGKIFLHDEYAVFLSAVHRALAKQALLSYVHFKPRTEFQIKRHLREKNHSDESIHAAINYAREFALVDDAAYAAMFARDYARRTKAAPTRIAQELRKRGITATVIANVMQEVELPDSHCAALECAQKALRKNKHKQPDKRRQAVISYLQRQGYTYSTVKDIIQRLQDEFQ